MRTRAAYGQFTQVACQIIQCAAADQGQSAVQPTAQGLKGACQRIRHENFTGPSSNFHQCAIKIEEKRDRSLHEEFTEQRRGGERGRTVHTASH